MKAIVDEAAKAERELIDPLLQFRHYGIPRRDLPGDLRTETRQTWHSP